MFNLYKVLVVFAALMCIAAAYPSIVGPAIIPALGPRVVVGPIGAVGPVLVPGLGHGAVLGHSPLLLG